VVIASLQDKNPKIRARNLMYLSAICINFV
jgi:hypothetical protein